MTGSREPSPEVRALLDDERVIPAQPAAVRARAVARARAALVAGLAAPVDLSHAPVRFPWATSVTLACVVSAAVNIAVYQIEAHVAPVAASVAASPAPPTAPVVAVTTAPAAATSLAPSVDGEEAPPLAVISPTKLGLPNSDRAELRLLRRARAAVARADFAAALSPIAEHARRFRDGRLAEEREALRVGALVGLGRNAEARHAATAFRARFPHSVLAPAVNRMSAAAR